MADKNKIKTQSVSELSNRGRDIFWNSINQYFDVDEKDQYPLKSKIERGFLNRMVDTPYTVKDASTLVEVYNFRNNKKHQTDYFIKNHTVFIDGFYTQFKDNFVEEFGKNNFLNFVISSLKNRKMYYSYDETLTDTNAFNNCCLNDPSLREDYAKKMVAAALHIDIDRNPRSRSIQYRNSIYALKNIKENAPDLFEVVKRSFIENKHFEISENKIGFFNAISSKKLFEENPSFRSVNFNSDFKELNAQSSNVALFDDNIVYMLKMKPEALLQINPDFDTDSVLRIGKILASSLSEVFPEYTFEGGEISYSIEESKNKEKKTVFFSFDSRFGSLEAVKEVLPEFIKNYGTIIRYKNSISKDNNACLAHLISDVQTKDKQINLSKMMDKQIKNQQASYDGDNLASTGFKL